MPFFPAPTMEPYAGPSLNRWASALPQPYRLVEGMNGLTPEQMAIYEDLIGPLQFLASDASAYVTGTELRIDGGFTAW